MITANFFQVFYNELKDSFTHVKNMIINILSNIHEILNKFMPDDIIILFGIAIVAFIIIFIFRIVIKK